MSLSGDIDFYTNALASDAAALVNHRYSFRLRPLLRTGPIATNRWQMPLRFAQSYRAG